MANRWEIGPYWRRVYRARIRLGFEWCRGCGEGKRKGLGHLTFDHIVPRSGGGATCLTNVTVLCGRCNAAKADGPAPAWMVSLADEEAVAPEHMRWSRVPGYLEWCVREITGNNPELAPRAPTRLKAQRRAAVNIEHERRLRVLADAAAPIRSNASRWQT